MNAMEVRKNEVVLIYNSKDIQDREALGYAEAMQYHKMRTIDTQKEEITPLQLARIARKLKVVPARLIDRKSDVFQDEYAGRDLTREGMLTAISKDPRLLKTPILVYPEGADFVNTGYQFVNKDMDDSQV